MPLGQELRELVRHTRNIKFLLQVGAGWLCGTMHGKAPDREWLRPLADYDVPSI